MAEPAVALERLLGEVRAALRNGAYDRLPGLAERQARLLGALEAAPPRDGGAMRRLRRAAAENAPLLEAALAGMRAARRPAAEPGDRLAGSTYDRSGRRRALETGMAGRELRRRKGGGG